MITLNFEEIKNLIPHREPFIFIDELINIEKLKKATGVKTFSMDDDFFKGHFPEQPVVPGVIIVEMMAQTAAALIAYSLKEETFDKIVYLMNIDNTKFRKPVFPDDKIYSNVNALRSKGRVWKFVGNVTDNKGYVVAESNWCATIMDKKK